MFADQKTKILNLVLEQLTFGKLNPQAVSVAAGFTIATGTGELRNTEEHNCHGGQG